MPIPKPTEDEVKDDFVKRCMVNEVMLDEYSDGAQRLAVCNTQWKNKGVNMSTLKLKKDTVINASEIAEAIAKAFAVEDEVNNELTAEIFSVGKWNGMKFTLDDFNSFVTTFKSLKTVLRVPLKFGHNEKQAITDGLPALGWVTDVWVNGNKLLAKFSDMPDVVYQAIQKKLYKTVSIEASFDVKYKDEFFKSVLTGVALLGADLPAVNNLKELTTYMSADRDNLLLGDAKCFTYDDKVKEVNKMSDKEELLQKQLKESQEAFAASETARVKAVADAKLEKDAKDKLLSDAKGEKFTAAVTSVTADLESLVKDKKITPAKRDELVKTITDDASLAQVKFSADMLKDIKMSSDVDDGEQGKQGKDMNEGTSAEEVLLATTRKFQAEGKDFKTAQKLAFDTHPKEAREYIDANDEDAA